MARSDRAKLVTMVLAIVVAGVFLFAMTAGDVWHHHDSPASQAACPICHFAHQGFAPVVADQAITLPEPIEWKAAVVESFYRSDPFLSLTATRAPPAALPA